jgi:hypothetical protein
MRAMAFVICLDCGEVMTGFANETCNAAFCFSVAMPEPRWMPQCSASAAQKIVSNEEISSQFILV